MPRNINQWVVVSYFSPKEYLHVYGIYETRSEADNALKVMSDDSVTSHGKDYVYKNLKFWVKKVIQDV